MRSIRRHMCILVAAMAVAAGSATVRTAHAADTPTPHTFAGMSLPQAWQTLHPAGGGPVIHFTSSPGTGPTQLAVIQTLYPEALSQISTAEQDNLAAAHVGSDFTLSILQASAPAIDSCIVGCSTPCTDPNLCDYFEIQFSASGTLNGYDVFDDDFIDGYRDDGASTNWQWQYEDFNGEDQPFSQGFNDWSSSIFTDSTYSYSPSAGVVDYATDAYGNGHWSVVGLCICFPPTHFTFSEDLYADYCVNEQVSNQYGTTSRLDKFFAHGTSYDGGSVTYGDWGLETGGC